MLDGLPAAAERPIDGTEIQSDIATSGGQLVLLSEQLSLDREDAIEVDKPLIVLFENQLDGPVRGLGALGEAARL